MAELADALDSGSNGRKAVQVQVLLPAPNLRWANCAPQIFSFLRLFCPVLLNTAAEKAFIKESWENRKSIQVGKKIWNL